MKILILNLEADHADLKVKYENVQQKMAAQVEAHGKVTLSAVAQVYTTLPCRGQRVVRGRYPGTRGRRLRTSVCT